MAEDLKKMYRTIMDDQFPPNMEITFVDGTQRQTLFYEKVTWIVDGVEKGLRYGENPGQEAALYKLVNGNLVLGETQTIQPGQFLAVQLAQEFNMSLIGFLRGDTFNIYAGEERIIE